MLPLLFSDRSTLSKVSRRSEFIAVGFMIADMIKIIAAEKMWWASQKPNVAMEPSRNRLSTSRLDACAAFIQLSARARVIDETSCCGVDSLALEEPS